MYVCTSTYVVWSGCSVSSKNHWEWVNLNKNIEKLDFGVYMINWQCISFPIRPHFVNPLDFIYDHKIVVGKKKKLLGQN